MEWKNLDKRTKFSAIEVILLIILLLFLLCYHYEDIANYFYGTDNDSKGKLLATILTAIGGICVIWGLYLNNRKVNEQARQNDISVQNSNDKRFGEAIGYLNNDNEGIAIGGVYALYQLAKEDSRYTPIITNIFCNYINDNTDKPNKKSYQTIISLLFSIDNPFIFEKEIMLKDIQINNATLYCKWNDIHFFHCSFNNVSIINTKTLKIGTCKLTSVKISECKELHVWNTESTYPLKFESNNASALDLCQSTINQMIINTETSNIKHLLINGCKLNNLITIRANSIDNVIIKKNDNTNASINISVKNDIITNKQIDDIGLVKFSKLLN